MNMNIIVMITGSYTQSIYIQLFNQIKNKLNQKIFVVSIFLFRFFLPYVEFNMIFFLRKTNSVKCIVRDSVVGLLFFSGLHEMCVRELVGL